MKIYGLKTCDTCRKAIKALPRATFVDVRTEGVPDAVMEAALATFGTALVNTRSTTWRALSAEDRLQSPKALLKEHPTLMKRPLVSDQETLYLGWSANVREALTV